ncbi:MAG: TolC family protein [Bacteroidia bacterium]|nr:TolC family protein [Bacteroidia bacterium]
MKKFMIIATVLGTLLPGYVAFAQGEEQEEAPTVLTLDEAVRIALSENVSVKVADKEIERAEYARKGTYASLFPQVDASASYSRTIKKQVMYMDFDMGSLTGGMTEEGAVPEDVATKAASSSSSSSSGGGIEVGRWNTYSAGMQAALPLVNAQLWKSIKISAQDVELAVEKARSSRLETVTQVKQAFFGVLLAKEAFNVYKEVYENALENFQQTEKKYNADKASELDYQRAKSTVQNAIPNVYDSESSVVLGLWQLKAVMGIDLDENIDVAGSLMDYAATMPLTVYRDDELSLESNSSLRQLGIQAEELANNIKVQQYASLPTLALSFSYSLNAMTNDFKFSEYNWSPYSAAGLSLSIPIFAGGRRANAVRQARNQYDQLKLQSENTERQLRIAIRQYLNQMETGMKNYSSAESGVETARKAYDIASKSYNLGRSTITELNNAQLSLTQAQLAQSQAVYSFMIAKANLEQTLGKDFNEE